MMLNELVNVKPIKSKEFIAKQSTLQIADTVPVRSMIISPSTGGKTTLMVHIIMKMYKDCFSKDIHV